MKGAILHKLGLNAIKERVMRRHYGVEYKAPFEEGVHPEHLKTRNAAGTIVCRAACKWYANKVRIDEKIPQLTEIGPKNAGGIYCQTLVQYTIRAPILRVRRTSYTDDYSRCLRGRRGACLSQQFWYVTSITHKLMSAVMTLCSVIVDLSPLKPFKTITNSRNPYYYYVNYELGVT